MRIAQFVRRVAFVAALAVTCVAVPARAASAMPRNPCQDYRNEASANLYMAQWWGSLAQTYYNLGWFDLSIEASFNAEVYADFAEAYMTAYSLECR